MYYLQSNSKNNKINCNTDLIIMDGRTPIVISLYDIQIKNKKICADLISINQGNSYGDLTLKSREDIYFSQDISTYNIGKFRFKTEKGNENYAHTMIYNNEISKYCINWDNENLVSFVTKYLRNVCFLPLDEDIVSQLICKKDESLNAIVKKIDVYTSNPIYENLEAYIISEHWIKEELKKVKLNNEVFKNDLNWDEIEDIEDYIFTFLEPIKDKLKDNIKVLYNPKKISKYMFEGKKKPFDGQIPIIQSGIEVLNKNRFVYIAAEQGFGKTNCSTKINHSYFKEKNKNNYYTLCIVPALTLKQWEEELKESIGDKINVYIIRKTDEFIRLYNKSNLKFDKPTYILVGKETFKLDSKKRHGVNVKRREIEFRKKEVTHYGSWKNESVRNKKEIIEIAFCPDCGVPLQNQLRKTEDVFFTEKDFMGNPKKSNYKCNQCQAVLWQNTYDKTKKSSLIRFIKTKNIHFDSVLIDEVHQSNNGESIIGNATRTLFNYANKILLLSGTSNSGYSSSFHNLMIGLLPNKLKDNNVMDITNFIKTYGTLQAVTNKKDGDYFRSGRSEIKDSDFKEIEGVNPILFTKFLAQNYVFATLNDLGKDLPNLNEYYIPIQNSETIENYERVLLNDIKKGNSFNSKMYESTIVKHYINNPFNWSSILIQTKEKEELIQPINIKNEEDLLNKEIELLKIIKNEVADGRKCCLYIDFNNGGQYMQGDSLPNRIEKILKNNGIKTFQLKTSVPVIERKELLDKKKDEFEVLITNPILVQVGLNLTFISTYINYMPSYRYDIVSQSNRRGFRANSTLENRIYHLYYENSIENNIIKRYQRKMAEAQAIEAKFDVALESEDIRTSSIFGKKLNDSIK